MSLLQNCTVEVFNGTSSVSGVLSEQDVRLLVGIISSKACEILTQESQPSSSTLDTTLATRTQWQNLDYPDR